MRKGGTWDEIKDYDLNQMFRKQEKRSLDEIDTLLTRQEYLKQMLGQEKSKEIEENPDLFYNHERFRIWQAKARFRAILTTAIVCPTVFTILNNNRNGIGFMKSKWYISVPMILGTYITSFYVWHRIVGYNNQAYLEQTYSKNVKMLRNLLIKQ